MVRCQSNGRMQGWIASTVRGRRAISCAPWPFRRRAPRSTPPSAGRGGVGSAGRPRRARAAPARFAVTGVLLLVGAILWPSPFAAQAQETAPNRLTEAEVAEGWTLLFDGTLEGWRGYRRDDVPGGWSVQDASLAFSPGVEAGSLVTEAQYGDFDLVFEWRVLEAGNSGVFYRGTEEEVAIYWTAPEYQILDNGGHRDGANPETSAGANYGLHAPARDMTRPVGEWNEGRIVARGARIEHWMNGVLLLSYELWGDDWRQAVARTKFADWPRYGMARRGHVGLQDHGDPVWYRNLKIRTR